MKIKLINLSFTSLNWSIVSTPWSVTMKCPSFLVSLYSLCSPCLYFLILCIIGVITSPNTLRMGGIYREWNLTHVWQSLSLLTPFIPLLFLSNASPPFSSLMSIFPNHLLFHTPHLLSISKKVSNKVLTCLFFLVLMFLPSLYLCHLPFLLRIFPCSSTLHFPYQFFLSVSCQSTGFPSTPLFIFLQNCLERLFLQPSPSDGSFEICEPRHIVQHDSTKSINFSTQSFKKFKRVIRGYLGVCKQKGPCFTGSI